ncbi:MAG: hypothetical protein GXO26_02745 [Crenarchaeota archaeon]|nr:hypothetical protein [Thermoproteota archaeon]
MSRINSVPLAQTSSSSSNEFLRFPNIEKYISRFGKVVMTKRHNVTEIRNIVELERILNLPVGILKTVEHILTKLDEQLNLFAFTKIVTSYALEYYIKRRFRASYDGYSTVLNIYYSYIRVRSVVDRLGRYPLLLEEFYNNLSNSSRLIWNCLDFQLLLFEREVEITESIVNNYLEHDIYTVLNFVDEILRNLGEKMEELFKIVSPSNEKFYRALSPTTSSYKWSDIMLQVPHRKKMLECVQYFIEKGVIEAGILKHAMQDGVELYALEQALREFTDLVELCRRSLKKLSIEPPPFLEVEAVEDDTDLVKIVPVYTGIASIDEWKKRVINYFNSLQRRLYSTWCWIDAAYRKVMSILEKQLNLDEKVVKITATLPTFYFISGSMERSEYSNVPLTIWLHRGLAYGEFTLEQNGERKNYYFWTGITPGKSDSLVKVEFLINLPAVLEHAKIEEEPAASCEVSQLADRLRGR